MSKQSMIIQNLLKNPAYTEVVYSHLNEDFFTEEYKIIFKIISEYVKDYSQVPKISFLRRVLSDKEMDEESLFTYEKILNEFNEFEEENLESLVKETEDYCYHSGLEKTIVDCYNALDSKKYKELNFLYESLKDKFAFSFENHIGHSYFEDYESQYSYYTDPVNRLSFGIPVFNDITNGGLDAKRLVIFNCGTHVGKTLMKCSLASSHLKIGKKVVFITLEDSKEGIVHRIDANLYDSNMDSFPNITWQEYEKRMKSLKEIYTGDLIVQEFPLGSNANEFYNFIKNLRLKKNFFPDIIYVDYLGVCGSYRVKSAESEYTLLKKVAEELRGLSQILGVPVVTSCQNNRGNQDNSDPGMDAIADSFAIPRTADILWSLWSSPEMKENNQILLKQLKNRLRAPSYKEKIILGCDYSKMKIFQDTETSIPRIENNIRKKREPEMEIIPPRKEQKSGKKDFSKFQY